MTTHSYIIISITNKLPPENVISASLWAGSIDWVWGKFWRHSSRAAIVQVKWFFLAWWKLRHQPFFSNSHQWTCLQANHLLGQAMWPVIRLPSSHYLCYFCARTFYFISPARILFTKFINWNLYRHEISLYRKNLISG